MRGKTELSPKMVLVAATIAARGPMQAQQAADATGLSYHTARQYLRRLVARGVLTADRDGIHPVYRATRNWKVSLNPVKREPVVQEKRPPTMAPRVYRVANSVFALGAA